MVPLSNSLENGGGHSTATQRYEVIDKMVPVDSEISTALLRSWSSLLTPQRIDPCTIPECSAFDEVLHAVSTLAALNSKRQSDEYRKS